MQRQLRETPSLAQRLRAAGEALEIAPTHIIALITVASCACAGLVVLWWTARPPGQAPGPPAGLAATAGVSGSAAPSPPAPDRVVVHISGAVASPGVQTLPGDARVDDAIQAAGGPRSSARTDQLNLARPLRDGEQIHVPSASEVAASVAGGPGGAGGGSAGGAPGGAGLINLNRATAAELEELPEVGPVLAEHIMAFREANGGFRSVDDLQQVSGIGEKTFAALKDLVTV